MTHIKFSERVSEAARRDILEFQSKISQFTSGEVSPDAFRKYRLTRGVYGQRQPGVQMIRIKLPYGRITTTQLERIADCSDKYATGNLHATTRQDIQLHFVKLADAPALWSELEDAGATLKEACGNTVRNVTASPTAGIDPDEPFDVSPYAQVIFEYFLRNPVCQDMGRKFKIGLSSSEKDTAFGFMHDVGLIPRIRKNAEGKEIRGFRVLIGGGLGAQPVAAPELYDFLEEEYIIPLIEAIIRVFDRYGERTRRNKARMKYLLGDIGLDAMLERIEEEWPSVKNKELWIDRDRIQYPVGEASQVPVAGVLENSSEEFKVWFKTNVFEQKQKGWYAVTMRVLLGDISSTTARALAKIIRQYALDDIRVTANQGYLFRFVRPEHLRPLFEALSELGLADPGFDSTADVTTCPGTDTCNLAITSSYGITKVLEQLMKEEFPDTIYNNDIKIKISGCMNGCGQHSASNIGYHGSSIKHGKLVGPALQILLGGGFTGDSDGTVGEKVIKIPTKRGPESLRRLLNDYEANAFEGEYFNNYYARKGKAYNYQLLKSLADLGNLEDNDYREWDHAEEYNTEVGVGECAGDSLDLVATTLIEAREKYALACEMLEAGIWADAIYHSYNVMITGAKALLLSKGVPTNTQYGVARDFDEHFGDYFCPAEKGDGFRQIVFTINKYEPSEEFARYYVNTAREFLEYSNSYRERELAENPAPPVLQELGYGLDS